MPIRLVVIGVAMMGALTAGFQVAQTPSLALVPPALLCAIIAWRFPSYVALFAILLVEEVRNPPGQTAIWAPVLTFGNYLYYGKFGSISVAVPIFICLAVRAASQRRLRLRGELFTAVAAWAGLMLFVTALQTRDTNRLRLITIDTILWNQQGILLVCGLLLGAHLLTTNRRTLVSLVAVLLVLKGGIAVYVLATGQGADISGADAVVQNSGFLVYYDAAGAFFAAAVLAALLLSKNRAGFLYWCVVGASAIIVVTSLRRNIWFFLIACIVVGLLLSAGRFRLSTRVGLLAATLGLISSVVSTPILSVVASHFLSAAGTLWGGGPGEASTDAHEDDIRRGLEYALERPLVGWGSRALQLPGLASGATGRLYVHNEFLETWLRFGALGVLALALLLLIAMSYSVNIISRRSDVIALTAGFMAVAIVVPISSAPYVTTTFRWPILFGMALGAVSAMRSLHRQGERSRYPVLGASLRDDTSAAPRSPQPDASDHCLERGPAAGDEEPGAPIRGTTLETS